ncbi:Periplasmic protein TonB, links inner and outer membranes (plasmid) [Nostoc flagelliforme CCNUN1]|uniref:Periplasmic protein TonB, links inner and outer membranes n=1 Tax=Nostoc flagelliforme CCNUN1 TaxID=2038116 RepID=A0A2K8TA86_9NOSO|nr:hypothetical protein [Nostoc flagelliforme]AUB44571.1 Periplasmic protein TonB, links inner and outer membranes [Nostoc flagelliforme CCNUN1]
MSLALSTSKITSPKSGTNCFKNQASFLTWEARSRDTLEVKRCYVDVTGGDLIAGILLSQIIYWHLPNEQGQPRLKIERDGEKWLAKKREDWWDECRITPKQFDSAIKLLESKNLIKTARYKFGNAPTKHIRIDWDNFLSALTQVIQAPSLAPEHIKTLVASGENENDNFPKGEIPKKVISENGKFPKSEIPKKVISKKLKFHFPKRLSSNFLKGKKPYIDTEITTEITSQTTSFPSSQSETRLPDRQEGERGVKKNHNEEKELIPESLTSLSKKSESSPQTDIPSRGHNTAAGSFEKIEQQNKSSQQDPFLSNRTFIPAKGTYKSNSTDPWMKSANMPNEEFAIWLFDKRYKAQGKMLSDAKAEIRNNFERASDLWSEFLAEKQPTSSTTSKASCEFSPIGYFANRSLDWHKATFNELLDRMDEVGKDKAIASFSSRYDQQDPGATLKWLDWLKLTHPQMYVYLHPQAA